MSNSSGYHTTQHTRSRHPYSENKEGNWIAFHRPHIDGTGQGEHCQYNHNQKGTQLLFNRTIDFKVFNDLDLLGPRTTDSTVAQLKSNARYKKW